MDSIILQTGDNTVTDGDVIGRLGFAASSETGTNARLVVAKIEAVAEEAFDASNNATEMVFYLAADGAAASKMTLTSAGNLNIGGELQTTNIGYTDGDNAIVIADGGGCTFPQDATFSGSIQVATVDFTDGDNAITIADGGGVTLPQAATFSKAVKTPLKSNTYADPTTFNLDEANTHTVTLGGNPTLAISNEDAGQKFIINLVQDGTGSRTVTWFSTIKWAGGSAPTLTTTANKADSFGFLCTGTDAYYGFVIGQNI